MTKSREDAEVRRMLTFIGEQEQVIKTSMLEMFEHLRSDEVLRKVRKLYKQSKFKAILELASGVVEEAANVLDEVFAASGEREMRSLSRKFDVRRATKSYEVSPGISLSFDVGNESAARALSLSKLDLIREISDKQEKAIRSVLSNAQMKGLGAVKASKGFRDSIGLTKHQKGVVNNYRRLLETGNGDALSRTLRDHRFDSTVRSAFDSGRILNPTQIDRMVGRYEHRMLAMRSETIARTEALRAVNAARHEAVGQMAKQIGAKESDVTRTWRTVIDGRERHTHRAMNGQKKKGKESFVSPSGAKLRYPGDRNAPPKEVINCRCVLLTSIGDTQAVTQQPKPTNAIAAQPPVMLDTRAVLGTDSFVENWLGGFYVPKSPITALRLPRTPIKDFKKVTSGWAKHANGLYEGGFTSRLTTAELKALENYTTYSYRPINKLRKYLRGTLATSDSLSAMELAELSALDSAMSKAVLPKSMVVYRGAGSFSRFEQWVKNMNVGQTVMVDKGFMSTTLNKSNTTQFTIGKQRLKILVPKGSRAISVEPLTASKKEFEILLDRNSVLVVRKITEKEITLELLPQKIPKLANTPKPVVLKL